MVKIHYYTEESVQCQPSFDIKGKVCARIPSGKYRLRDSEPKQRQALASVILAGWFSREQALNPLCEALSKATSPMEHTLNQQVGGDRF